MNQNVWLCTVLGLLLGGCPAGCQNSAPKSVEQLAAEQRAFIENTAHASALLKDQGVKIDANLETDGNVGVAQKSEWYLKSGIAAQLRITNDPVLASHLRAQEKMWAYMDKMQAQQERFLGVIEAQRPAGAGTAEPKEQQPGDSGASEAPAPPPDPG